MIYHDLPLYRTGSSTDDQQFPPGRFRATSLSAAALRQNEACGLLPVALCCTGNQWDVDGIVWIFWEKTSVFLLFFSHDHFPGQILNSNSHSVSFFCRVFSRWVETSRSEWQHIPLPVFRVLLKWVRRRRIEYPFPQQIWRIRHDKPTYRFLEEQSLELSVPCRDLSWHVFVTGQSKINQSHF